MIDTIEKINNIIKDFKNKNRKLAFILVGHQYVGKSTFIRNLDINNFHVVSLDDNINKLVDMCENGMKYNEGFNLFSKTASVIMRKRFQASIKRGQNIIIDQTNMNSKSRSGKIKNLKYNDYVVYCIDFPILDVDEIRKRYKNRPEQHVPLSVVFDFINNYEKPDIQEGFKWIFYPN